MSGGVISNNVASTTAGRGGVNGCGGGIYVGLATLTLENVAIKNNAATLNGGGVFLSRTGSVKVTGGTIATNLALNSGGGIYNVNGSLTLSGKGNPNNVLQVTDNTAANQGGGLYLAVKSTTTFNGVNLIGNKAAIGKGVYWQVVKGVGATVNPNPLGPPAFSDQDDPGGQPFPGP